VFFIIAVYSMLFIVLLVVDLAGIFDSVVFVVVPSSAFTISLDFWVIQSFCPLVVLVFA